MISFQPSDEEVAIRDEVRRFAEKELRGAGRECERARAVPAALRESAHGLGLSALDWPEALGGAGLSLVTRMIVEEELARGDAGLACALDGPGAAGTAIRELGSEAQRARLLAPFAKPEGASRIASLAISESDLGAELGSVRAKLVTKGDRKVLCGTKCFVPQAADAALFVVLAREGDAADAPLRMVVVDAKAPGIEVGREDDRLGLQALRSFTVRFDDTPVAPDDILAPETAWDAAFGRFLARSWLVLAARQVGIARAAVEYATFYAQDRQAFGKKIGQFQGIAFKIADMATEADAARWLVWRAASELEKGRDGAEQRTALAAVQASAAAVKCAIDCVQVLGGAGFMEDYPAEKWMRESRTLAQLLGGDAARMMFAGDRAFGPLDAGPAPDPAAAFAAFGAAFGVGA